MGCRLWGRTESDTTEVTYQHGHFWGFAGGVSGKEPTCQCRKHKKCGFGSWVGKIPWREGTATQSGILAWRIPWTGEPGGPVQRVTSEVT